jgi:carbon monoxide dehydrogenase subunit G
VLIGAQHDIRYRRAMQRVERTARIAVAPDELFAYVADLDNLPEWQSGVTSTRRTSDGELGVGATAHVTRELMGQRMDAPLTVTDYDPPHQLGIGSELGGVKAAALMQLRPADGGSATDLTFSMEIRGSRLTSFMEPMIASAAGGDIDASLERLRQRFSPDR